VSKKINSRSKGNRGERILVKKFSSWWGKEFYRTPGSGSFATRGYKHEAMSLAGDVVTTDETFPFCIESKNAEGWHLEQLLTSPRCDIIKWWEQAVAETPEGKIPLLVFTRNHQPHFFMMPIDYWYKVANLGMASRSTAGFIFEIGTTTVKLGLLDELFERTQPDAWRHHVCEETPRD